jgi:signal transduction histidine kinase
MSSGANALLSKYRSLLQKHEALVQRLAVRNLERYATWRLYAWALETSASGLALLREGHLQVANARWYALGRGPACWRPLGPPGGAARRTLLELTQAEATAALQAPGSRAARYQREDGVQVLEVRAERVGPPAEGMALVLVHDATEQVRAEEELARARQAIAEREHLRALGELATGIAHDLHTTLHSMRLRLELLQGDGPLTPNQQEHLEALARIVTDASARLSHLQHFARQRLEQPLEPVQLAEVAREAVEVTRGDMELRAAREGLTLRVEVEVPPLPPVHGSAADLRYALGNLLLNARDAMPHGGTVRVRGRQQGDRVVLTVEDEGTGIPEEHLPHLFRPFFTTKGPQGIGLGLSLASGAVARAGGTLTAANRPEGGALFTLTFPSLSPHPEQPSEPSASQGLPPPRRPRARLAAARPRRKPR